MKSETETETENQEETDICMSAACDSVWKRSHGRWQPVTIAIAVRFECDETEIGDRSVTCRASAGAVIHPRPELALSSVAFALASFPTLFLIFSTNFSKVELFRILALFQQCELLITEFSNFLKLKLKAGILRTLKEFTVYFGKFLRNISAACFHSRLRNNYCVKCLILTGEQKSRQQEASKLLSL